MNPTLQELASLAIVLTCLVLAGVLTVLHEPVPDLIAAPVTFGVGVIFGSRASNPE